MFYAFYGNKSQSLLFKVDKGKERGVPSIQDIFCFSVITSPGSNAIYNQLAVCAKCDDERRDGVGTKTKDMLTIDQ